MGTLSRPLGALVAILVVSAVAGCFKTPDLANLRCTTSEHCPDGYACAVSQPGQPGACVRTLPAMDSGGADDVPAADAAMAADSPGSPDVVTAIDIGAAIDVAATDLEGKADGMSAVDGASDSPSDIPIVPHDAIPTGPEAGADVLFAKLRGATCSQPSECADGFCADGRCCDRACAGTCEACDLATSPGTCAPLGKGASPRAGHGACAAADVACGGSCDGVSGSCTYPSSSVPCGSASCTGTTYQPAGVCDGAGACSLDTPTSCGAFACGVSGCLSSCSSNSQCATGAACVSGRCVFCLAGQTVCPNLCVNLQTDSGHCGTCSTACGATEQCSAGACRLADGQSCNLDGDCASGVCSRFYADADADGHPVSTASLAWCHVATAKASGYVPARSDGKWDCYDGDGDVYPGQLTYFLSEAGGYGWDYDCSGAVERRPEAHVGDTCVLDSSGTACVIVTADGIPDTAYACGEEYNLPTKCSYLGGTQCNWMGGNPSGRFVACR